MSDTLYAWGRKIKDLGFLDHVFVTDYPLQNSSQTEDQYWYCWGQLYTDYRAQIVKASGSVSLANSIMPANEPAYSGSPTGDPANNMGAIVYYGLDGTCHQTANEVLAATGSASEEPSRVSDCHGYALTTFFYGTYGTNKDAWDKIVAGPLANVKLAGDDFLPLLEKNVPEDQQEWVKDKRTEAQAALKTIRKKVVAEQYNYYTEMQAQNAKILAELRLHLGKQTFLKLFPSFDGNKEELNNGAWMLPPE